MEEVEAANVGAREEVIVSDEKRIETNHRHWALCAINADNSLNVVLRMKNREILGKLLRAVW